MARVTDCKQITSTAIAEVMYTEGILLWQQAGLHNYSICTEPVRTQYCKNGLFPDPTAESYFSVRISVRLGD